MTKKSLRNRTHCCKPLTRRFANFCTQLYSYCFCASGDRWRAFGPGPELFHWFINLLSDCGLLMSSFSTPLFMKRCWRGRPATDVYFNTEVGARAETSWWSERNLSFYCFSGILRGLVRRLSSSLPRVNKRSGSVKKADERTSGEQWNNCARAVKRSLSPEESMRTGFILQYWFCTDMLMMELYFTKSRGKNEIWRVPYWCRATTDRESCLCTGNKAWYNIQWRTFPPMEKGPQSIH